MDAVLSANELHHWVVMTEACLNRTKPSDDGFIRPKNVRRLNVHVGKESVHRSILIWDRILKATQASGFKVRMEKEAPCRTIITVNGEELSVSLKEKTTRKEHVLTIEEKERAKKYTHLFQPPKWDFLPSGRLVLAIDYFNEHKHRINEVTWTDGDKKRVEDRLDTINDVLTNIAKDLKDGRVRAAEWRRQSAEEERRRWEAARLQDEKKKWTDQLEQQASSWKLACSIRGFIDAVRDETIRGRGGIEPGSPLDHWIQWAERHANTLDPVGSILARAYPADHAE